MTEQSHDAAPRASAVPGSPQSAGVAAGDGTDGPEPSQGTTGAAPAQEIRTAAERLRCDHRHPVQPPGGSFAKPGDCSKCGLPYGGQPVRDDLAGPLAALLDSVGSDMQQEHRTEPVTLAEGCAHAIAQAINSGIEGESP